MEGGNSPEIKSDPEVGEVPTKPVVEPTEFSVPDNNSLDSLEGVATPEVASPEGEVKKINFQAELAEAEKVRLDELARIEKEYQEGITRFFECTNRYFKGVQDFRDCYQDAKKRQGSKVGDYAEKFKKQDELALSLQAAREQLENTRTVAISEVEQTFDARQHKIAKGDIADILKPAQK